MAEEKKASATTENTTEVKPKKKKTWLFVLGGCFLVVIICIVATVIFTSAVIKKAIDAVNEVNVTAEFCNASDEELIELYNKRFTTGYKEEVSFAEFKKMYQDNKDMFGDCDKLEELSLKDLFAGTQIYFSQENNKELIYLKINLDGKYVEMNLEKVNDEWLIDDLNIEGYDVPDLEEDDDVSTELANPASEYCEDQGGKLETRQGDYGEEGYCVFDDGSECEEWAFYWGTCKKGAN